MEERKLEVRLVQEALGELLKENLFRSLDEFQSKEKYIQWQLSRIFSFPVDITIHLWEEPFLLTASFLVDGEMEELQATIN